MEFCPLSHYKVTFFVVVMTFIVHYCDVFIHNILYAGYNYIMEIGENCNVSAC